MLRHASVILAEALARVVPFRLCQITGGGLFGWIFIKNQVLSAKRFVLATYACVGKLEDFVSTP
jgi:hypothetical protein